MKTYIRFLLVFLLIIFGFLTFFLSSTILLDLFDIRAKQGDYVPFVVWANLIASMLYFIAAYGFIKRKNWTFKILGISIIVLLISLAGLYFHIKNDGLYEHKTIGALFFRISLTFIFFIYALYLNKKSNNLTV